MEAAGSHHDGADFDLAKLDPSSEIAEKYRECNVECDRKYEELNWRKASSVYFLPRSPAQASFWYHMYLMDDTNPTRGGTSVLDGVLVEYSLEVPRDGNGSTAGDDDDDAELIDGCIEYTSRYGIRINLKLKSRIYGPVDMEYAFIERAVEVEDSEATPPGCDLIRMVTALTSGCEEIVLFHGSVSSSPVKPQHRMLFSSVVAVSLDGELNLGLVATAVPSVKAPRSCRNLWPCLLAAFHSEHKSMEAT